MTTAYAPVAESSDNLTIGQHVNVPTLLLAYVSRNRDGNLSKKGDTHTHTRLMGLFHDYLGKPVPER